MEALPYPQYAEVYGDKLTQSDPVLCFFKKTFYFLEREKGREKQRVRNIDV